MAEADHTVQLSNGRCVRVVEDKVSSWEGGSVWPPALLLAQHLDAGVVARPTDGLALDLPRCRVLELGAGCGTVGLVASCLGAAAVVLTDLEVALPTLHANVRLNGCEGSVTVCALDWRDASYPAFADGGGPLAGAAPFGLVIASECIYDEDMAMPLVRTMHHASGDGTVCLLAGIIGGAALSAFRREAARYFEEHRALPPLRAGDDALPASRGVHVLCGKREVGGA